jgi:hypothetical protein
MHYVPYFLSQTKRLVVIDERRGVAADRLCEIGRKDRAKTGRPLRVTSGLMHRSKLLLFDYFVGAGEQLGRQPKAELLCCFLAHDQFKLGWNLNW